MSVFNFLRLRVRPPEKKPPPKNHVDVYYDVDSEELVREDDQGVKTPLLDQLDAQIRLAFTADTISDPVNASQLNKIWYISDGVDLTTAAEGSNGDMIGFVAVGSSQTIVTTLGNIQILEGETALFRSDGSFWYLDSVVASDAKIPNYHLADMPQLTIKGATFAGTPADLTAEEAQSVIGLSTWWQNLTAHGTAAYVDAVAGSASGAVGRPDRPYQTVAQALAAASIVVLQTNATMGTVSTTGDKTIVVPAGITLTATGHLVSGSSVPRKVAIVGGGNLLIASTSTYAFHASEVTAKLSIDLRGDVEFQTGHALNWFQWSYTYHTGNRIYFRANRVRIYNTGGSDGPFTSYNETVPQIVIGEGTRILSDGPILSVGGPGTSPKIHLGAGVLLYRNGGGDVCNGAGSAGGLSAAGAYYYGTISSTSPYGVFTDASAWLTIGHLTI